MSIEDQGVRSASSFQRQVAVLTALGASDELANVTPSPVSEKRLTVVLRAAEFTQDTTLFLRLYSQFAEKKDSVRAFAALEDAVLADMRLSTDKHVAEFHEVVSSGIRAKLFSPAQLGYFRSLFDRYAGVLE